MTDLNTGPLLQNYLLTLPEEEIHLDALRAGVDVHVLASVHAADHRGVRPTGHHHYVHTVIM